MHFTTLQGRLVAHVRARVRGGELTERSAARLTGVSQPHLHNVLKGARLLSTDMADQVLRSLNLCVLDLLEPHEFKEYQQRREDRRGCVPWLDGHLGPGLPFPPREGSRQFFPFPLPNMEHLGDPVLVQLADDPRMYPLFSGGDVALLDRDPDRRRMPEAHCCYALDHYGEGLVRRLELRDGHPGLRAMDGGGDCETDFISLSGRNILELVKAKVVWIGRNLEPPQHCTETD
jgi:hypothetical protein